MKNTIYTSRGTLGLYQAFQIQKENSGRVLCFTSPFLHPHTEHQLSKVSKRLILINFLLLSISNAFLNLFSNVLSLLQALWQARWPFVAAEGVVTPQLS